MRNLPNILGLLGDSSFLGLILQKLLYVWAQVLCIHVLVCVRVCTEILFTRHAHTIFSL